jgi:hypothetical protein
MAGPWLKRKKRQPRLPFVVGRYQSVVLEDPDDPEDPEVSDAALGAGLEPDSLFLSPSPLEEAE